MTTTVSVAMEESVVVYTCGVTCGVRHVSPAMNKHIYMGLVAYIIYSTNVVDCASIVFAYSVMFVIGC